LPIAGLGEGDEASSPISAMLPIVRSAVKAFTGCQMR
jgi:hypothetical protein